MNKKKRGRHWNVFRERICPAISFQKQTRMRTTSVPRQPNNKTSALALDAVVCIVCAANVPPHSDFSHPMLHPFLPHNHSQGFHTLLLRPPAQLHSALFLYNNTNVRQKVLISSTRGRTLVCICSRRSERGAAFLDSIVSVLSCI